MYKILKNTIEMDDYSVQKLSNLQPPEPFEWNTVEGTEIDVSDSAEYRGKIEVKGNTEQEQLSGKNKWSVANYNDVTLSTNGNPTNIVKSEGYFSFTSSNNNDYSGLYIKLENLINKIADYDSTKSYVVSCDVEVSANATFNFGNTSTNNFNLTAGKQRVSKATTFDGPLKFYNRYASEVNYIISNIQIEEGSEATDYEPYCGGQASPSPSYSQNIEVVTGDNVVKHVGKNLLNLNNRIKNVASGVSLVTDSVQPNSFRMGGKSTWGNYVFMFNNKPNTDYGIRARFKSTVATTIRLSVYGTNVFNYTTSDLTALGHSDITSLPANTDVDLSVTFNSGSYKYLIIRFWNNYTGTALTEMTDMLIDNIQLEEGTTATPYEPYREENFNLNLGNIELCKIDDYQDILFKNVVGDENYNSSLTEGAWYKKGVIDKAIADGSKPFQKSSYNSNTIFYIRNFVDSLSAITGYCSNFIVKSVWGMDIVGCELYDKINLRFGLGLNATITTAEEFNTWITNNPQIIYYILATPTYEKITDPTLISQLEALNKAKWFKGVNHWWTETENLEPVLKGTYRQAINE